MSGSDGRPASLLLIFGPPAVGKTTVGQEIERLTGLRLFHIHQVIDLVTQYFPYSSSLDSPYYRLLTSYRRQFSEEAVRGGLQVIATLGWWLDTPAQVETIREYIRPFLEC